MAIAPLRRHITEEEFMRLPDDGRKYELVNGEPQEVPTGVQHDIVSGNVFAAMHPFARGRGYMTLGQAGFRMASRNIRSPDVSFTRKERFPDGMPPEGFGESAPDLCVEVISPSEERADMGRKVEEYFASGARMVWQLFPDTRQVIVFTSPSESRIASEAEEIDAGEVLPGFRCRVGDFFSVE